MNEINSFNSNLYRNILFEKNDGNIYKSAEIQRKCTALLFDAASKSLDNASACDLLQENLAIYTKTVYKEGTNIYNDLLLKAQPNIQSKRRLKITDNPPKLDLNTYFKDLECAKSTKLFCNQSEKISQSEVKQFEKLFAIKKEIPSKPTAVIKNKINLEDRLRNLDKLQGPQQTDLRPFQQNTISRFKKTTMNKNVELSSFTTASDELENQIPNRLGTGGNPSYSEANLNTGSRKKLGTRKTARSKFVSPLLSKNQSTERIEEENEKAQVCSDPRLKNIEPKMVELIMAEIMDQGPNIGWDDIAGLEFAKSAIQEAVVWPMLRPDIFTGLRRPPKGILLFGPPGTGKTLIGKCVAAQSKSTFFSISASSLTSKWIGDGEKMVRALFAVARVHQPAVIFIDEIDSLLTQRSDTEHESSRRIKTEFLVQLDGATTDSEERLLVIGATNRPQELDEAARRRFVKRLYIPLPEFQARLDLLKKLISKEKHSLQDEHFSETAKLADGFSGADIKNLCSEAALGPIRSIDFRDIENIQASQVRPLAMIDFEKALKRVRPSVAQSDLVHYIQWDKTYGTGTSF